MPVETEDHFFDLAVIHTAQHLLHVGFGGRARSEPSDRSVGCCGILVPAAAHAHVTDR